MAAEGMQFPWRGNGGTISPNLGVNLGNVGSGLRIQPSHGVRSYDLKLPRKGIHLMVWVLRAFGALFIIIPVGALTFSYLKAYSHP